MRNARTQIENRTIPPNGLECEIGCVSMMHDSPGAPASGPVHGCRDHRQFDEARLARRVVDPLRGFSIILRLGPEDVVDEGLRIAVVEREPARLNLHHDAVARQEDVVRRGQGEAVEQRLAGRDGLWRVSRLSR